MRTQENQNKKQQKDRNRCLCLDLETFRRKMRGMLNNEGLASKLGLQIPLSLSKNVEHKQTKVGLKVPHMQH